MSSSGFEVVFFNRYPDILFSFLYHIEAQNAHPKSVHRAFEGFHGYMTSKGYDTIAVATTMRQTIGHHSLAHMARKRPPNVIERKVFEV